jgi:hypothetical protein
LEEQLPITNSLIQGQPQLIITNNCSSMDDLIHAMGAMNLFTSNAMGAMDPKTQRRVERTVYTPNNKEVTYMLCLQCLNHLGSTTFVPYGTLRLIEPLVHHHRLLNHRQPKFGWKPMPYSQGLHVSPIHYIHSMTSRCCHTTIHYIDDARHKTTMATHLIYTSHHGVYVEMQQRGPLRYNAKATSQRQGITLSQTSHLDKIGVKVHKATVLHVLASRTSSDQSNTRTWLCFHSKVVAYLPFDRGPGPH